MINKKGSFKKNLFAICLATIICGLVSIFSFEASAKINETLPKGTLVVIQCTCPGSGIIGYANDCDPGVSNCVPTSCSQYICP